MTTRSSVWVQSHLVTIFYLLAFAISWIGWVPTLAASAGLSFFAHPLWAVTLIFPAIGPALAAKLALQWQRTGHTATPLLSLFRWRVSWRWYAFAIITPLLLVAVSTGLSHWLVQQTLPVSMRLKDFMLFLLLSVLVNPWEEVGWRGFALTRLQARYSAGIATGIVGVLWGVWHLPLFFVHQGPMSMAAIPFWPWFVGLLGQSFIMTWLFNRSGRSLLIVALYHIATNGFSALIGVSSYWALAGAKVTLALSLWLLRNPVLKLNQNSPQ